MKIGFIGGFGHHYLKGALIDAACGIEQPIAVAPSDASLNDLPASVLQAVTPQQVRQFRDVATLIDQYRPDVLSVGAVYGFNGEVIAAAMERAVPAIVSDKPIATTRRQLDRLRGLARERIVLTEFDFRARATFRAARQAVRDGRIGVPVLATAQKSYRFATRPDWYKDRDRYGGTMLWVASHGIDAIRFVTDRKILAAVGRGGNVSRPKLGSMEEYVTAIFELEGGGSGIVHADYYRPEKTPTHGDDRLRVAGTRGVVEVRAGRCTLLGEDGIEVDITDSVPGRPMHAELLAAINGETTDLFSTAASLEMAEVLLCAREAADTQNWVRTSL
jgi:predicted dehydrogenase